VTPSGPNGTSAPLPISGRRIFGHMNVRRISLCQALGVACPPLFSAAANPWPAGLAPAAVAFGPPDAAPAPSDCRADPVSSPAIVDPQPNNPLCPHCFIAMDWNDEGRPALVGVLTNPSAPRAMCLFIEDASGATSVFNFADTARTAFAGGSHAAPLAMPPLTGAARAWLAWEEVDADNEPVTIGQPVYLAP